MNKIAVLGAGLVGHAIVKDLAQHHHVRALDIDAHRLHALSSINNVDCVTCDVNKESQLATHISDCELVINAVPGAVGFTSLQRIINLEKNVVDIAFYSQEALTLNALALEKKVTAIVDIGLAPGLSNLILGRHNELMQVNAFSCWVGGLPKVREWPMQYKAPFSPGDVIEEYTRPARLKEAGKVIVKPALSDREYLHFERIGTLEAFNTDGLRSLLQTMAHIPNMKEKTLRYPGHAELIDIFRHLGFFNETPLNVNAQSVIPRALTSALLFKHWTLAPDDREFSVMRIEIEGTEQNEHVLHRYDLYDEYDQATRVSSMARTTGYTCTAAANMLLNGLWTQHGVFPPEKIGAHKTCDDFIMEYLAQRDIRFAHNRELYN